MKRRSLIKAFTLSASIAAMGMTWTVQAAETIKVGILHSLSGTMAISETSLKDMALMTIDEINAKGGVNGKMLEAVVVDPASNWPLFAEKGRQLLTQDKVAVVFGCWTSVSGKYDDAVIWQRGFHDHIIRDRRNYEKIAKYIYENPIRWHAVI